MPETKYRIDGGVMLVKNTGSTLEFAGFFNDQPAAHARIKELSQSMTTVAQDYFLVTSERLMPVEMSDEPI
jgi:hypothetical protein